MSCNASTEFCATLKSSAEKGLRRGSNPVPPAPEAGIIPLDHEANASRNRKRKLGVNGSQAFSRKSQKCKHAHRGARTHDHKVKSLALYQLS